MKRLHVDPPEDIDDHKETDLLQRLVISWDTPPEQLAEVVNEVDTWLAHRSDESVSSVGYRPWCCAHDLGSVWRCAKLAGRWSVRYR